MRLISEGNVLFTRTDVRSIMRIWLLRLRQTWYVWLSQFFFVFFFSAKGIKHPRLKHLATLYVLNLVVIPKLDLKIREFSEER